MQKKAEHLGALGQHTRLVAMVGVTGAVPREVVLVETRDDRDGGRLREVRTLVTRQLRHDEGVRVRDVNERSADIPREFGGAASRLEQKVNEGRRGALPLGSRHTDHIPPVGLHPQGRRTRHRD